MKPIPFLCKNSYGCLFAKPGNSVSFNVHMCIHSCIHTYIYIHAYIHACVHTYIHTYIHTYVYIQRFTHASTLLTRFNKIAIPNNKFQMASGQGSHWFIESPTIFSSMRSHPYQISVNSIVKHIHTTSFNTIIW